MMDLNEDFPDSCADALAGAQNVERAARNKAIYQVNRESGRIRCAMRTPDGEADRFVGGMVAGTCTCHIVLQGGTLTVMSPNRYVVDIEALSDIRTEDAFLTAKHDVAITRVDTGRSAR